MNAKRILFVGGGTAGSVTPLLAVAAHIRQRSPEVAMLFVGSHSGPEEQLAEMINLEFRPIPAGKLRRYFDWQNLSDLMNVWRGYRASVKIVREWKPEVVVSAGSFVAVPMAWAAHRAGCRVVIHQQDVRPGLANRLMIRAADIVTVSFLSSLQDFRHHRVVYTGNPVRSMILRGNADEARKIFSLEPHLPVVLVLGGGTGSQFINSTISEIAHRLVERWQVIHVTGPDRDWPELQHRRYHRYPFLTWQIPHALAIADLVISRAGLGTMTELAATAKPSIIIPMPDTHQEDNAMMLQELNAAVVLDQATVTPESFLASIDSLGREGSRREVLATNIHQLYRPDAVAHLADLVLEGVPS